jgi:hypothetical protein
MNKKLIKYIVLIAFGVFFVCVPNCRSINNKQQNLTYILRTSFDKIYLAKGGLEYPHTKQSLNRCIQYNDAQCLDTYNQVLNGKETIKSLADNQTLEATLDIIEEACLSKNEDIANFTCYGGIMSLYFYNTPEQDEKIRARIKKYPKTIKSLIFNHSFYWYQNRPNPNEWIDYVSTLDIEWENTLQKEYLVDLFKKNFSDIDDDPWVLR